MRVILRSCIHQFSTCNIFIMLFLLSLALPACRKEKLNIDPSFRLHFSQDTISFDTIFTTLGSTTAILKVYNPSAKAVDIQSVELIGGHASVFRINVDGDTALLQSSVRLAAHDSLYVFVTLTLSPNASHLPFEIIDYLRFVTSGGPQEVVLKAWGQNAIFHLPTDIFKIPYEHNGISDTLYIPYSIADCSSPWTADLPHVVYGYLFVGEGQVLTLEAGSRLHFATDAGLWVGEGGSLRVDGQHGNEVRLEGMRLDADYKDLPAQWNRIWLSAGSINNRINYAIIRNGNVGLWIDSVGGNETSVEIRNTIIHNMQQTGIWAQGANIRGENLQVSNCGDHLLALQKGGDYRFEHCTFANYFRFFDNQSLRKKPSLLLNNYYRSSEGTTLGTPLLRAEFNSCIIYGSLTEEIQFDLLEEATAHYRFEYCNLRTEKATTSEAFSHCQINLLPGFKDPTLADFDLKAPDSHQGSGTVAKGKPGPSGRLLNDIRQRPRAFFPSIGAYEFSEE